MAYMALYRKFRPQGFSDVKGQDVIVSTLQNELRAGRIGHAYLFTGTRGTGKTSVAKIFARAVNCENPREDRSPCGECPVCRGIAEGTSMNVIEMDAASNNKVDDIRQLIEEVDYPPPTGRYKVYIIDEVHMLTSQAFNAFLKTLEEPPSYVIFILATTEVHKIPITILSRCQRYDFRRIPAGTVAARLSELLAAEGIQAEEKAVDYVARVADGSMRDGISLLDQCIAFYLGQTLTYENVLKVLGAVDIEVFSRLLRAVLDEQILDIVGVIDDVVAEGKDISRFVTDFVWYLRSLLLLQADEAMAGVLDLSGENRGLMAKEAHIVSGEVLMRYIRVLSELLNQLRFAAQKRVLLEIALLRLARPQMDEDNAALLNRIEIVERKLEKGIAVQVVHTDHNEDTSEAKATGEKEKLPKALPEEVRGVLAAWQDVMQLAGMPMRAYLSKATVTVRPDGVLALYFDDGGDGQGINAFDYLRIEANRKVLEGILNQVAGAEVPFEVSLNRSDTRAKDRFEDALALFRERGALVVEE